jgi:ribosomal subunit interface protein
MEIKTQAVHFELSEHLENFVQKKISKLELFHDGILSSEVTLRLVKPEAALNKQVSVKLNIKNGDCFAEKTCDTFEEAIDSVANALEKQLKIKKDATKKNSRKFWNVEDNN